MIGFKQKRKIFSGGGFRVCCTQYMIFYQITDRFPYNSFLFTIFEGKFHSSFDLSDFSHLNILTLSSFPELSYSTINFSHFCDFFSLLRLFLTFATSHVSQSSPGLSRILSTFIGISINFSSILLQFLAYLSIFTSIFCPAFPNCLHSFGKLVQFIFYNLNGSI